MTWSTSIKPASLRFRSGVNFDGVFLSIVLAACVLTGCALQLVLPYQGGDTKSPSREYEVKAARHYPPALYPQVENAGFYAHNTTWYVISAYIDMRPERFGALPALTFLSAGPSEGVKQRRTLFARVFSQSNGAVIALLECSTSGFDGQHHHDTQHAVTSVICSTGSSWIAFKRLADKPLDACLQLDPKAFCDIASRVPIGTPQNYPLPLLPQQDIALCIPGVRGDIYRKSFRFFTDHYSSLRVDSIFVYMTRPGYDLAQEIENAAARSKPRLVILPWCMQRGASYKCKPGQPVIQNARWFGFAGTNFGQLLMHQDCLFRSIGAYRWVLFVDLDEYIVPMTSTTANLHDLALASYAVGDDPPAEIVIRSAFYESCLPDQRDHPSVALSANVDATALPDLPAPLWSAARVSEIFSKGTWRTKFMCDPLGCDRLGVHFALSMFCQRYPNVTTSACKSVEVPITAGVVHHARAASSVHGEPLACSDVNGIQEIDWTLTNRALKIVDRMADDQFIVPLFSRD
jgi:hypothetical protein